MKECARLDFFSMCVLTHWDAPTQFFVAATANLHQKPKTGRQTSNAVTQENTGSFACVAEASRLQKLVRREL